MKFTNNEADEDIDVMPFGKHKGTVIGELPDGYILFMCFKFDEGSDWRVKAERERDKRKFTPENVVMSFGEHKGDMISDLPDEYLRWCVLNLDDHPIYPLIMQGAEDRCLDLCEPDCGSDEPGRERDNEVY